MIPWNTKVMIPMDAGLKDWHHDPDGRVNYTWQDGTEYLKETGPIDWRARHEANPTEYREECTDEALDNLAMERYRQSARREAFREMERWSDG